ncbi:TPA: hypothetical protein ACF37B_003238 [Vibrio parahaemolyticus]
MSTELDISHLAHHCCDLNNKLIRGRITLLRQFAKKTQDYVKYGNSIHTVSGIYATFQSYIRYCDSHNVNPFTKAGYLSYFGNDGELRHQIKTYTPSLRLWQRNSGDEIGIKESTVSGMVTYVIQALVWCGIDAGNWRYSHRPFNRSVTPFKAYSKTDEQIIVTRLSDLFFGISTQLIAHKTENLPLPEKLAVSIDFNEQIEVLLFPTSLKSHLKGKVNASAAFNIAMGAAYHLLCYFTSLNHSVVRSVCHPIKIETESRERTLKTIKIRGFKARANRNVSALVSNETDEHIVFDVEKKTGVAFIETLAELSSCFGGTKGLLYTLTEDVQISDSFYLPEINRHLIKQLNLVTSYRILNLPWFSELFYTYQQNKAIELKTVRTETERAIVMKRTYSIRKENATRNTLNISYCILSCFTDKPLKGILLPLSYSERDDNGNIQVSFFYHDGKQGYFDMPAGYLPLVKDIESWATTRADAQSKSQPRFLLRTGSLSEHAKQWDGINPLSSAFIKRISVEPNDYFLTLQSSRFRETTSSQEYREGHLSHLKHLLQNTLATLEKHYANGHPETNKCIISQAIQVLERIAAGHSLEQAEDQVKENLRIDMLTHTEWLKNKVITNPNGVICTGKQNLKEGKNTQRATNKAMQQDLPCSEFDMCHKCKSAKAVDEPNAIYKLISFIDVLREALDRHPNASRDVQEKINAFEYTLEGASSDVLEEAMQKFNKSGRHPRITMNHATLSIYR